MNYSLTQAGNLTALAGFIVLIAKAFKPELAISESEITTILASIGSIVGIIISWIGRYRAGGVTKVGFKR